MVPVDFDFATESRTHWDPKDSNSLFDNLWNTKQGLLTRDLIFFYDLHINGIEIQLKSYWLCGANCLSSPKHFSQEQFLMI